MKADLPKEHILAKLYYDIGKQATNFSLQHSHKQDEETIWTKRHTFLELSEDPHKNTWMIQHCNHRQILKNEIILDFDRTIPKDRALDDYDVKRIIRQLTRDDFRFCVYHSGSKGVHIHIYWNPLAASSTRERVEFRELLIESYTKRFAVGLDKQLALDSAMIALEHVPHWKTGNRKTLVLNNGVEEWPTTQ